MFHGLKCNLTVFGTDLDQILLKYVNFEPCSLCGQTGMLCTLFVNVSRKETKCVCLRPEHMMVTLSESLLCPFQNNACSCFMTCQTYSENPQRGVGCKAQSSVYSPNGSTGATGMADVLRCQVMAVNSGLQLYRF